MKWPHYTGDQVQKQVRRYLAAQGLIVRRQNTGAAWLPGKGGRTRLVQFGRVGDPDLWTILPGGRYLGIECKASGELPTAAQGNRILQINREGGAAFWCDRLATVERLLPLVACGYAVSYTSPTQAVVSPPDEPLPAVPLQSWPEKGRRHGRPARNRQPRCAAARSKNPNVQSGHSGNA